MAESKLRPRFYIEAKLDPQRSAKEGRDCYREIEMVEIVIPGDMRSKLNRRVTDHDRNQLFKEEYKAFIEDRPPEIEGIPLREWVQGGLGVSRLKEFEAAGVLSVEDLAALTDGQIVTLGSGTRSLVERAKAYLEELEGHDGVNRLAAENEEIRRQLEDKDTRLHALEERLRKMGGSADNAPIPGGGPVGVFPPRKFVPEDDESSTGFGQNHAGGADVDHTTGKGYYRSDDTQELTEGGPDAVDDMP